MPDLPSGGIGTPPVQGIPASSGAGIGTDPSAYLRFLQSMMQMQQMQQRGAGIAAGARLGIPAGPTAPAGVPVGGATAPTTAAGGGMARASVPAGTPGTTGSAFPAQAPQVQPAMQIPYAATGRGAIGANAVYGISNMLAQRRQEDQQKEYTQAENLWGQILNAQKGMQDAAAHGLDDPYDQQVIDSILSDKRNVKMIQDALGTLTMAPDGQQQQQQDPTKQAQAAGARSALQKFGRAVGGAFDPRTQAQRIPGGTPMPGPNQPGGVMWNYPQPTQEQISDRLSRESITPEEKAEALRAKMGLTLTAEQKATQQRYEDQIQMQRDWHQGQVDMQATWRQEEVDRQRKKDEMESKDRQAKIAAAAAAKKVDPGQLNYLVGEFMAGRLNKTDLSKINDKNLRDAVFAAMQGHPFANPLSARQQENLQYLDQSARILPDARANLDALVKQFPDLEEAKSSNWKNFKVWAENRVRYGAYQAGPFVDPMWTKYYEYVGTIEARGLAPFLQVARNRGMMDLALIHIPKPTDTPAQLREKFDWFDKYIIKDTQNEINATRWGTNIAPYPGDVPPSGAPSPTGGEPIIIDPEDYNATVGTTPR